MLTITPNTICRILHYTRERLRYERRNKDDVIRDYQQPASHHMLLLKVQWLDNIIQQEYRYRDR